MLWPQLDAQAFDWPFKNRTSVPTKAEAVLCLAVPCTDWRLAAALMVGAAEWLQYS